MIRAPATIVAFDGLVVDTRSARALAIAESMVAEDLADESSDLLLPRIHQRLAGRSLDEAVDGAITASHKADSLDSTRRDLVVLRARRAFSAITMRGLPLCDGAAEWLTARAASHGRVVLRADSARVDVERMLAFSGLTDIVSAIRCADDPQRSAQQTSIVRSWRAIADRLQAQGLSVRACEALECDEESAAVARGHVDSVRVIPRLALGVDHVR